MAYKFCPECGAPAAPGGRFCVGCGQSLAGRSPAPLAGLVVLASLVLLGGGFWLYLRLVPPAPRALKPGEGRSAAAPATAQAGGAPSSAAGVGAGAGAGAPGGAAGQGHPQMELPEDIKQYIAGLATDAESKPKDAAAWQTLARVYYRASRLDPSYLAKAESAYQHLVDLDANNLDGIRGLGNMAYDRQDRARAIELYTKYLDLKPDDSEVRTDMATMYFESGQPAQAISEYERVIAKDPSFFQAYFNLGVIYDAQGDRAKARAQLEKARDLATDDTVKQRITALLDAAAEGKSFAEAADEVAAKMAAARAAAPPPAGSTGAGGPISGPAGAGSAAGAGAAKPAAAAPPATTFAGAVEQLFRGHPIAGPKIVAVEWPATERGRIVMSGFPMGAMPEAMRASYLEKMRKGVVESRDRFAVAKPVVIEIIDQGSGEVMATVSP